MEKFLSVTGLAAPMPAANVDTDVIMPKVFLKGIDRSGLARGLFHDLRFDAQGGTRTDFILNRAPMQNVRFLLTGPNFGCGSSREHAVWGLLQYGIRALIGSTFAGIFADNAANNGLLLVTLGDDERARLARAVGPDGTEITVDLATQTVTCGGLCLDFGIEPSRRQALMEGRDKIATTLQMKERIRDFEAAYFAEAPWLARGGEA
ncbi:3-isopropylmalate dehydratase small subunit [Stappia stellulata]|uniref:3-isopropylmalate dehydratase small subunit n=1 Tax=Stappia stellulata TaxID=71235 RepID=UPI00040D894B|nr:3-isopropylmalate dehydratase small subunit [Stappia stellulata]